MPPPASVKATVALVSGTSGPLVWNLPEKVWVIGLPAVPSETVALAPPRPAA